MLTNNHNTYQNYLVYLHTQGGIFKNISFLFWTQMGCTQNELIFFWRKWVTPIYITRKKSIVCFF